MFNHWSFLSICQHLLGLRFHLCRASTFLKLYNSFCIRVPVFKLVFFGLATLDQKPAENANCTCKWNEEASSFYFFVILLWLYVLDCTLPPPLPLFQNNSSCSLPFISCTCFYLSWHSSIVYLALYNPV